MQRVLTAAQTRAVDKYMIEEMRIPSLLLMENAAAGVARAVMDEWEPCCVHVYCGVGNNGGDGLAAARILLSRGYDVYVAVAGRAADMTPDTAANFAMFEAMPERALCFGEMDELAAWDVPPPDVAVDALLGTGLSREVDGFYKELIRYINDLGAYTVAVDLPSGVSADTGAVLGAAVAADATVTFQYPKAGHFLFPGRELCGTLSVVKIGVDDGFELAGGELFAVTGKGEGLCLPARAANTNKGDYGKLLLVAGSRGMAGAAVLAARAASRAGAGLVTVGAVDAVVDVVQQAVPEATCKALSDEEGGLTRGSAFEIERIAKDKTALAIGPGLGGGEAIRDVLAGAVRTVAVPLVIDADGVNALAGNASILREKQAEILLTPHPREFARLADADTKAVAADPLGHAKRFAQAYGVTLLLKGATSVVAAPDGRSALIACGTPGMARGGSGDVLTGLIGGLMAQKIGDPFSCAVLGAWIAGAAGEMAAGEMGEYSMTPMDEVNCVGFVMQKLYGHDEGCECNVCDEPLEHERAERPRELKDTVRPKAGPLPQKTAEEVLREIEQIEKTQEMRKVEPGPDGEPTRRRIG